MAVGGSWWRGYVWCNIPPASEHSDAVGAGEHLEIGTLEIEMNIFETNLNIYESRILQGDFFNWASPKNVSRLPPPPKFAWTPPP